MIIHIVFNLFVTLGRLIDHSKKTNASAAHATFNSKRWIATSCTIALVSASSPRSFALGQVTNLNKVGPIQRDLIGQMCDAQGVVDGSIRRKFGNRDSIQINDAPNYSGHHYLSLNSLGKSALSPIDLMKEIQKNVDRVFPKFTAVGQSGMKLNQTYVLDLQLYGISINDELKKHLGLEPRLGNLSTSNPVKVTAIDAFSFTFEAAGEHSLKGTARHAIIEDETGELWLIQEGNGVVNENKYQQAFNYDIAWNMWPAMSKKVSSLMNQMVEKKSFKLGRLLQTGLSLNAGDKVMFSADGFVGLGFRAGTSDPDGINYGTDFNLFDNINHGSLIGKLGQKWCLLGRYAKGSVEGSGPLILDVNDSDQGNNWGGYKVEVQIYRKVSR